MKPDKFGTLGVWVRLLKNWVNKTIFPWDINCLSWKRSLAKSWKQSNKRTPRVHEYKNEPLERSKVPGRKKETWN